MWESARRTGDETKKVWERAGVMDEEMAFSWLTLVA